MSFFINLFAPKKYADMFSACQEWLKGKKTYIAGAILLLQATAGIIDELTGLKGLGGLLSWLKDIGNDTFIQQFSVALGILGFRAALHSHTEAVVSAVNPPMLPNIEPEAITPNTLPIIGK